MLYFLRTCKDLRLRVYCFFFFFKEGMGNGYVPNFNTLQNVSELAKTKILNII